MDQFIFKSHENIIYGVSRNIAVRHAFSTRAGGVSTLAHTAGMNLAHGRGDAPETVRENLRLFCGVLGVTPDTVVSAHQIHSARVERVERADAGRDDYEADGFVTNEPGVTLCVRVADCVPILFCDQSAGVIGACHAGWRGTAAGIAAVTVEQMCAIGARPEHIQAAIGACIHPCCYEVSDDFYDAVAQQQGEDFAARHIRPYSGRLHADLPAMNRELLLGAGVGEQKISICGRCTCCEPEVFFSHRASAGKRGTMAAFITL